MDKTVSQPI